MNGLLAVVATHSDTAWFTAYVPCCEETWYHVVITWNQVYLTMYVNGSTLHTESIPSVDVPEIGFGHFSIGKPNNVNKFYGEFIIDELIYADEILRQADVENLFSSYLEGDVLCFSILFSLN